MNDTMSHVLIKHRGDIRAAVIRSQLVSGRTLWFLFNAEKKGCWASCSSDVRVCSEMKTLHKVKDWICSLCALTRQMVIIALWCSTGSFPLAFLFSLLQKNKQTKTKQKSLNTELLRPESSTCYCFLITLGLCRGLSCLYYPTSVH